MTLPAPTYDLMLLLDPQAEEPVRAKLVADARATIEAQGELLRHDDWGDRALTYPIDRRTAAEYHLMQFHAGTPELLPTLNRTLRIADDILRFRIIKLRPGVPEAPRQAAQSASQQAGQETEVQAGETGGRETEVPTGETEVPAGETEVGIQAGAEPPLESPDEPSIESAGQTASEPARQQAAEDATAEPS